MDSTKSELTLTVLGCGTLGTAILSGIFSALQSEAPPITTTKPTHLPSNFIACVTSPQSSARIQSKLSPFNQRLSILQNDNLSGVKAADVVIIGCKPLKAVQVLKEPGIKDALKGKLLISICAGVTDTALHDALYSNDNDNNDTAANEKCFIVRVMPNTNAVIRRSMTVIQTPDPPLSSTNAHLLTWIFSQIGQVSYLSATHMDAATALCGSGPAFIAYFLESLIEGGKRIGLPADQVQFLAANVMEGTVVRALGVGARDPAELRREVVVEGGCTYAGIERMRGGDLGAAVVEGVVAARDRASELGQPGIGH